jgi:hypothetical protein
MEHIRSMYKGERSMVSKVQNRKRKLEEREEGLRNSRKKNYSPDKFSRFITKNTNWNDSKNTFKAKRYFERKIQKIKNPKSKNPKNSYISFAEIQNIIGLNANLEDEKEEDFFSKDVRKTNMSFINFSKRHFLFDR